MSAAAIALTGSSNYFEDFITGDVYEHARGKTMEMLENVLITNLVLNTAQAHFNEDAASRLVAQAHRITFGGVTASLIIGLAMQDTGENAVEEIGLDKVRFRVPVLHGDTLYAFSEVVGKDDRPEVLRGHKDVGEIHFRHWGVNQRGETVFEGERRVLMKKRSFSTAGLEFTEAPVAATRAQPVKRATRAKAKARQIKKVKAVKPTRQPRRSTKPVKRGQRPGRR